MGKLHEEENLSFYHLENTNDWNDFLNELKSRFETNLPLINIHKLLIKKGCKTAIAESDYIDADYRNEFSNLYSKAFKKYAHFSTRLHFFEGKLNAQTIKAKDSHKLVYLGYVILRPTLIGKVGRTVIPPPFTEHERDCCLCCARFFSHILGQEFSIIGSPYIQQEGMVMACAQSSIWMAARYNTAYKQLFQSMPQYLPHDITENAFKYLGLFGRALPTEGLTAYQMVNALINMNYSPIMYLKPDKPSEQLWDPVEIIYRYISSKIPVIITVPEHALTVFGYICSSKPQKSITNDNVVSQSKWIRSLIIHDDGIGPYRLMPINKQARDEILKSADTELLTPHGWCYHTAEDIDGVIVPLPDKIYLLSAHINHIAREVLMMPYIQMKILQLAGENNKVLQNFLECLLIPSTKDPITIGGFVVPSFKYQEYLKAHSVNQGISDKVSSFYQKTRLSHYIWVVEISSASKISVPPEKRTIFGEILLDTTANRYGPSFLTIHLPGVLFIRDPHSEDLRFIHISSDHLYKPYPKSLVAV